MGQALRMVHPACKLVAVEPNESCTLACGEVGIHQVEGISDGFVPGIVERHRALIDEIVPVSSDAAVVEMRRLAREYGLFVGPSSGANLIAARMWRERHPTEGAALTFFSDKGEKYLSNYFMSTSTN